MPYTRAEETAFRDISKIAASLESIAKSLEKIANPTLTMPTQGEPYEDQS